MLGSAEKAIYKSLVRVGTVVDDVSHFLAFVADNAGAALALVSRLFAGPA